MEIILNEQVNTAVKLMIAKFSKDYLEKIAMVEVVKCLVNTDTGEIIKRDFVQNRIFRNRVVQEQSVGESGEALTVSRPQNDFDLLLDNINQMGEAGYFQTLLGIIAGELQANQ